MGKMTQADTQSAFAGESQAHLSYLIFADKAEKEGLANVARLFKAVAYAEQVHATNHFKTLKKIGSTAENLVEAAGGETHEVDEMYPAFKAVAELFGDKAAARAHTWAMEAEKVHTQLYKGAKTAVDEGKDAEIGHVHVCSHCGWTLEGDLPDDYECPLCKAKREKFVTF
jgi:rubrerythrin